MRTWMAAVLLAIPAAVLAQEHISDFVLERQEAMRTMDGAMAALEAMAGGAVPYDPARAAEKAAEIAELTGSLAGAFEDTPASRFGATSRAADLVWTQEADFLARMDAFGDASFRLIDAAGLGDRTRFGTALEEVRDACASCHALYLKPPR